MLASNYVKQLAVVVIVVSAACGEVNSNSADAGDSADGPTPSADATPDPDNDDAGVNDAQPGDAAPRRCDPSKEFGDPIAALPLNSDDYDFSAQLTDDERIVYFARAEAGTEKIYTARRESRTDGFGVPRPVAELDVSGTRSKTPSSRDGLMLYFSRDGDLYLTQRASLSADFELPRKLDTLSEAYAYGDPYATSRGLYFNRTVVGTTEGEIVRAERRSDGTIGEPVVVPGINLSTSQEGQPVVADDELEIYWYSARTDGGAQDLDIWYGKRAATTAAFGSITRKAALNGPTRDFPSWISADTCVLYLTRSTGNGTYDIYVATRPL